MNNSNDFIKIALLILIIVLFGPFLIKSILIFIGLLILIVLVLIIWGSIKIKMNINKFKNKYNDFQNKFDDFMSFDDYQENKTNHNEDYIDAEYSERKERE